MDILVSFCNSPRIPGWPVLGLLDTSSLTFRIAQRPRELPRCAGISGLGATNDYLFALSQEPASLLIFNCVDLSLANHYKFRSAVDPHSLWVSNDSLYAVSTGTDEVIRLQMVGADVISEAVFWRSKPEARRDDIHHLNAICCWRGDLLVSAFGPKNGPRWGSATQGFIFNITQGDMLAEGIQHPHSLQTVGDTLAFCESRTKQVRLLGKAQSERLPGYTRGLCAVEEKLFVGTSARRTVSKSTGVLNDPADPDSPVERCTVTRLSLRDLEIDEIIDLSAYAREIYDLLPVDDTSAWPVLTDHDFRPGQADWWPQTQQAIQEIAALVPPGNTFVLVDQDQWGTDAVAGRRSLPFLERDGRYWGPPPDDETGIRELEQLRQRGANFMAFAWPAFWWLDYYPTMHHYLRSQFRCILENDRLVVFDLRPTQ